MKLMVIVKASQDSEAGVPPSEQLMTEMMKFNEELMKAGVLLDAAGLTPSDRGARIVFSGKERRVVDGPFTETKELVAGYWVLQCKSLAECIAWMKRCPNPHLDDGVVEIRPLFEMEDFPHANAETVERAAAIESAIRS
jgi:hypothetical protein